MKFHTWGQRKNAKDRAAAKRSARVRAQLAMTPEDIERLMVFTIITSMVDRGTVSHLDFVRAGVPPNEIEPRFKRCLALAREDDSSIEHVSAAA